MTIDSLSHAEHALRALSCALLLATACATERPTPTDNAEPNSLAPPVEGPPPQQSAADQNRDLQREEAQGGKSLSPEAANRRMGSPGVTGNGTEQDSNTRAASTGVRAIADLDAIGGAKLAGKVTLQEQAEGVELSVSIEDAEPGALSVRMFDHDGCDDIEAGKLEKPLEGALQHGEVANLNVGQDGKGSVETQAAKASLKPEDGASLLGKVIVVQERSAAGDVTGKPLACGVVAPDRGLADKSGRAPGTTAMRTP